MMALTVRVMSVGVDGAMAIQLDCLWRWIIVRGWQEVSLPWMIMVGGRLSGRTGSYHRR